MKSLPVNNIVICSLIVVVIIVLLQPFGIDRIEAYKYPIIMGYGVLTAVAYLIAELVFIYILRFSSREFNILRFVVLNIVISIIMGFFITCYSSWATTGSLYRGWHNDNGEFTFYSLWINFLNALIISFFISVYNFLRERNKLLDKRLKEEMELNRILINKKGEKTNESERDKYESEPVLSLKGNTKEVVCIKPSSLIFMESEGNYVNIYFTEDEKCTKKTLRCTLKQMEDYFVGYSNILRCHRAFIVNIDKVVKVEGNAQGYKLLLAHTDRFVMVSRAYASAVYERIEA